MSVASQEHMKWSFVDRTAAVVVAFGFLLTASWFAFPTSSFIKQVSYEIEGRMVRFVRTLPFGTVKARWHSEITLIDGDGLECNSGAWRIAEYQVIVGDTVRYNIGPWADDCIAAGPPFYVTTTRQVMLFGIFPLKPDKVTTEIFGERDQPVVIIVPYEE